MGNLAGLVSPSVIGLIKQSTGSFTAALLFLAGALLLGALITILFGQAQRMRAASGAKPI
jgi:nitrate/nitrite transporter NarK